jgi:5,6,7,8-tetrahydromethanopterin hydro-lyase
VLIAAVWVNPAADDEAAVFANNRSATTTALRAGREGLPTVADALAARHAPSNAYYPA